MRVATWLRESAGLGDYAKKRLLLLPAIAVRCTDTILPIILPRLFTAKRKGGEVELLGVVELLYDQIISGLSVSCLITEDLVLQSDDSYSCAVLIQCQCQCDTLVP
jgi:hypothetical protein